MGGDYDRSNYKRMTMRSNTTYTLFDESKKRNWLNKMVIGVNAAYSRIKNTGIETNSLTGSALGNAMFLSPLDGVYADDEAAMYKQYAEEIKQYGDLVTRLDIFPCREKQTTQISSLPTSTQK